MLSNKKEMLEFEIKLMERTIPSLKGKTYTIAKSKYFEILHTYEHVYGLDEPIFLKRSE